MEFLIFATWTKPLADQASWISYGPARKSSISLISKHAKTGVNMAPHMPTSPQNIKNGLRSDNLFWNDNLDELNERFQEWLNE